MPGHECKHEDKLAEMHKMMTKVYGVFFEGNGKPSVLVQIDRNTNSRKGLVRAAWAIGSCMLVIVGKLIYDQLSQ